MMETFTLLAPAMEVLTAVLAIAILASSLDDLHFDARYWWRRLQRRLQHGRQLPEISRGDLQGLRQLPMVIMVPAWQEAGVIGNMLRNTLDTLDYEDFVIFVGTYVNDAETRAEVDAVARVDSRVRRVEVPHPGPTCKADCLNHVVRAVMDHQRSSRRPFAALVLHDSEDILHPLELQYFNAMLPRYDMVQLPVVALERGWREMVAGTYMDEFAEAHCKDMLVRQHMSGNVPSAGVGTCFSRAAVLALWRDSEGEPFSTRSLTEDYEVGMRLSALGLRSRFAMLPVSDDTGASRAQRVLSVREYFPREFRAACRQKARWMLGIGLQAWSLLPLRGRPWTLRYLMLHDRKAVLTALIPAVAYLIVLYTGVYYAGAWAGAWSAYEPILFRPGSGWAALLYANLAFLLLRAAQRTYFTGWLYGWRQGLVALPRMVVGNFVNCFAAARACRLYLAHRITGKPLAWEKTDHEFPDFAARPQAGWALTHKSPKPGPQPIVTRIPASEFSTSIYQPSGGGGGAQPTLHTRRED
jgi:bacteriophage N4 adsorption protein B